MQVAPEQALVLRLGGESDSQQIFFARTLRQSGSKHNLHNMSPEKSGRLLGERAKVD